MTHSKEGTTAVYVAAIEANAGKSTAALGLLRFLVGSVQRVGVFRPIIPADMSIDDDSFMALLRELSTVDVPLEESFGTTYDKFIQDENEALSDIVARYHNLADQCDAVVIVGTNFDDQAASDQFLMNSRIAVNLGAPILLTLSAKDRTAQSVAKHVKACLRDMGAVHATPLALIVDRADESIAQDLSTSLNEFGLPYWILPEVALLSAPTMEEIRQAIGGELVLGDIHALDKEASSLLIAGMTLPNILDRVTEDTVVVVPADREDVILGLLSATGTEGFPALAGIIWNGGIEPNPTFLELVKSMNPTLPILSTQLDTLETAQVINNLNGRLGPNTKRKVERAMSLMEISVDSKQLLDLLEVQRPNVVTPQIFEYRLIEQARADRKHIVLPEGDDDRILIAADMLLRRKVADLTILGDVESIRKRADELGLDLSGASLSDPATSPDTETFAEAYYELRKHKGIDLDQAREQMQDISFFATMMVHLGFADGMVSGAAHTTAHTIRPSLQIIKTKPGVETISGAFLMCLSDRVLVFADCAVVPEPSSRQLADIAVSSAHTASAFGITPRVALLSYSTGTSGSGKGVDKVREAMSIIESRGFEYPVAGPIQFDAAIDPSVAKLKMPESDVAGQATVLIFPDLNTGNNTYKAVQRTAGAVAIGPVLQGLNKPVNDLSRGAKIADIINTVAITAVQAQGE